MMIASLVKNLLVLFRYPRQETSGSFIGPHPVGAVQVRLPGATACQVHYPSTIKPSDSKIFHPYLRHKTVEGLADYLRSERKILDFLSSKAHPCDMKAEPIASQTFPLVIFSHGLSGSMEMYTQLCAHVASHGFVVVALEHEDGSGCFAESEAGDAIYYRRPDDTPYSREKVLKFRTPMLQQRVNEVEAAIKFFSAGPSDSHGSLLHKVVASVNTAKGVSLMGHSFGAATMLLAEQSLDPSLSCKVNYVAILDAWCFPLSDNVLTKGINVPLLSVLSEAWTLSPETEKVRQILSASDAVTSLWAPKTEHQSFSDSSCWLPSIAAKKLRMRGYGENRFDTIRAASQACVHHFRDIVATSSTSSYPNVLQAYNIDNASQSQVD